MGNRLYPGKYIDTSSENHRSVGICDRCSRKVAYDELRPDPNFPGLRVCRDDMDDYDPWRLAAIQTETITLRHPRPDAPLGRTNSELTTEDGLAINIEPNPPQNGNIES